MNNKDTTAWYEFSCGQSCDDTLEVKSEVRNKWSKTKGKSVNSSSIGNDDKMILLPKFIEKFIDIQIGISFEPISLNTSQSIIFLFFLVLNTECWDHLSVSILCVNRFLSVRNVCLITVSLLTFFLAYILCLVLYLLFIFLLLLFIKNFVNSLW